MGKFQDLTGQKFSRLTVIKYLYQKQYIHYWLCKCDCGNEKIVRDDNLKYGATKSCGCLTKEHCIELSKTVNLKHGLVHHRIRSIYKGMKERCYNKNSHSYKYYGAKGIKICDEWLKDLKIFYNWAMNNGYKDDLTIDRIDFNGDYCPENCRWVDMKTQLRNTERIKFITYNNKTMCMKDWAKELNMKYNVLKYRIAKGWDIEKAFCTPVKKLK